MRGGRNGTGTVVGASPSSSNGAVRYSHPDIPSRCGALGGRAGDRVHIALPRHGLADGLDAVREQGVTASRVLLIGGAAANPAVAQIAAEVFDAPVEVPEPGEYVALGAAAQAAWMLTGERPEWELAIAARPVAETHPEIRRQYLARRVG